MAGLVDYAALVLDLRGRLSERQSWGAPQLRELLDELEQTHRVDEAAEAQMLRHFGAHLTDLFMGLVPAPVIPDPLTADDRFATSAVMDRDTSIRSPKEDEWTPQTPPSRPPAPTSRQGFTRAQSPATGPVSRTPVRT